MPQTVIGFDSRCDHVIFVVDHVAPGQVFSPSTSLPPVSIVPPMLHTHSFIYMLLLREGQTGEAWEPSFRIRRTLYREVLPLFLSCQRSSRHDVALYVDRVHAACPLHKFCVAVMCGRRRPDMKHAVFTETNFAVWPTSVLNTTFCAVVLC